MERKTVFVIGAGASAEFGLPVGSGLQNRISKLVDIRFEDGLRICSGDHDIYQACKRQGGNPNEFLYAGWRIRDGVKLTDSIDNFLDKHHEDQKVRFIGKLGIARAISEAEGKSKLAGTRHKPDDTSYMNQVNGTWVHELFKHLQRAVRKEDVEQIFSNVSFVIFNYDRCVEKYLRTAVQLAYSIDESLAEQIVREANIFHPYGTIGNLPGRQLGNGPQVSFGENGRLESMASNLSTYTEEIENKDLLASIRSRVGEAEQLCFLGFSYQPQNMELLTPEVLPVSKRILGTAFGISEFNRAEIESDLRARFQTPIGDTRIRLHQGKCADLMRDFGRAFD
ncbi:hypothetical protein [Henriciella sp.]|uniref:hypothetical protein n=1 Tax=Henriciella sp. TaxID=1968823 RepID=UPI002612A758|nr:hypothetical protein [Henriciella sp.]